MSITLWHFRLDGPAVPALALLDGDERAAFRRFDRPALTTAFARRRAARRILLGKALGQPPGDLAFSTGAKPMLEDPSAPDFSASHSGRTGILAVAEGPVGADIEEHRPIDAASLARGLLAPAERRAFATLEGASAQDALFRLWCAKEAILKAAGHGLDLAALPLIALPVEPSHGWHVARLHGRAAEFGRWHVVWPDLGGGRTVALAAPDPVQVEIRDAEAELAPHGL